jgi:hypothetical protein
MTTKDMMMAAQSAQSGIVCGSQFDRIGIGAADADVSKIPTFPCQGTSVATVAAVCDTASATITLRMVYFNVSGLPCGSSLPITFTSDATADFGTLFMGVASSDMWRPVAGANSIGVKVDSVSAGHWSIHGSSA